MRNEKNTLQGMRYFFYILVAAVLGWFLFMQFFGANERRNDIQTDSVLYTGSVFWEKEDGTSEEITVPGRYDVPAGQTMILTTTLPAHFTERSLAIRSSLQDVRFYIDGQLRKEYSTKATRLAGKNSASRYIFCDTSYLDAGKELRIELTTYTSNYSGVVNQLYCGDPSAIWQVILRQHGASTFLAFFILLSGLTAILFSTTLGVVYRTRFGMEYFGWCMIMGAVWMLGESKIRQLLVPNASALASLCFVVILLCPIPFLLYADTIQKGLHRRLYLALGGLALANFIVCSLLHFAGILDYIETLPIGQLFLGNVFVLVWIHLFLYLRTSKYYTDYFLLFGLLCIILGLGIESASVYFVTSVSGIFVGISLLLLLVINIIRTIRKIQHIEAQRRRQELEKEQKQTEKMTLQMMQALSTTLEAKDEYTRGHSIRVAEYAAQIAAGLGLSAEKIEDLKNCAYLHDIGKIGIPDQILNKPGRLTEEEYSLIKQHPLIGVNILQDITLIPHLAEVTRSHHERFDGTGYPDGLAGTEIPLYARIVAVADCFDAMNSRRIYRSTLSPDRIRDKIRENSGSQFDPQIADVLLRLIDEGSLVPIQTVSPEAANPRIPEYEQTIHKFISEVVTTMKSQEDAQSFDALTGLPLRNPGEQLIAAAMQKSDGCLAFFDMDNLKKINDLYGHKAGDRALQKLGGLLSRFASQGLACRLGGDEFLLFLPNMTPEHVSETMTELFRQFRDITQADTEIRFAALSAGLCLCTSNDIFSDCYSKADKALYDVKQNGKNHFAFYHQISGSPGRETNLAQIAKALRDSGSYKGALDLNYRDFARQYEYTRQLILHNHENCYLILVTMDSAEEPLLYTEALEGTLSRMGEAISLHIRKIDVCTRYSAMQYLIILLRIQEAEIPKLMSRIFLQYEQFDSGHIFHPIYEYQPIKEDTLLP